MTLTEFLLARIAEDEKIARRLMQPADDAWRWSADSAFLGTTPDGYERGHIARWDPARVLAECEAKRQIVEQCRWALDEVRIDEYYCRCETANEHEAAMQAFDVLRALASVYADHPDYLEEWKP